MKDKQKRMKICINRKYRWLIWVALSATILLLFLYYLTKITNTKYEVNTNIASVMKILIFLRPNILHLKQLTKKSSKSTVKKLDTKTIKSSLKCYTISKNNCELVCSGEITEVLNEALSAQQTACSQGLYLTLTDCFFPDNYLSTDSLVGSYGLESLSLNCPIRRIENKTFAQPTLVNLKQLVLYSTYISALNEQTFEGLHNLRVFNLINYEYPTNSDLNDFLKPLAKTLVELQIVQLTNKNDYDPKIWFGDAFYENLINIDLAQNRFRQCLSEKAFVNLKAVEKLFLNDCEILKIGKGTFQPIATTLKYLNLKNNHLKHLDVNFLNELKEHSLTLELAFNAWNCDCEIEALINAIQQQYIEFTETPQCKTPKEWLNASLVDVNLNCDFTLENLKTISDELESTTPTIKEDTTENSTLSDATTSSTIISTHLTTHTTLQPTTLTTDITRSTFTTLQTSTPSYATSPPTLTTDVTRSTSTTKEPEPTQSPKHVKVSCNKFVGRSIKVYILGSDATFGIETLNETSVEIKVKAYQTTIPRDYHMLYLNGSKLYFKQPMPYHKMTITNLTKLLAYTFCLVPDSNYDEMSPFNCRSHYLSVPVERTTRAWLTSHDKALFISLTILSVFIFIIIGGVAMYFLLRWRPIWLKGNKRIVRMKEESPKIRLHPKRVKFQSTATDAASRASSSNVLDSTSEIRPHTSRGTYSSTINATEFDLHYEKMG